MSMTSERVSMTRSRLLLLLRFTRTHTNARAHTHTHSCFCLAHHDGRSLPLCPFPPPRSLPSVLPPSLPSFLLSSHAVSPRLSERLLGFNRTMPQTMPLRTHTPDSLPLEQTPQRGSSPSLRSAHHLEHDEERRRAEEWEEERGRERGMIRVSAPSSDHERTWKQGVRALASSSGASHLHP